jgi:hypothetical protein
MLLRHFDEFIIGAVDPIWEPFNFSEAVANSRLKSMMLKEMESI